MGKNRKRGNNLSEGGIIPLNTPVLIEQAKPNYQTVGTCRLSKSGQALSLKLYPENRYLHIRKRDIELIFEDVNHATVANIREYLPKEN
jgi:hypothetical protein